MTTQIMSNIGRKLQLALVSTVLASTLAVAVPVLSASANNSTDCAAYDLVGGASGGPDGNVTMLDVFAVIARDRTNGSSIITVLSDVQAAASHFGKCPPPVQAP